MFKVYEENPKENEKPVLLRLMYSSSNSIILAAVDELGRVVDGGNILTIHSNGTFSRMLACMVDGISVDKDGCIKESKD